MRKLVLSAHITLDGFASGPDGELDWHFSHWNDEMEEVFAGILSATDTILMGRITYEVMAEHWPAAAADPEGRRKDIQFAEWMNRVEKIVFSRKLSPFDQRAIGWSNTRLVRGKISETVDALKKEPGKAIIVWGGVSMMQTFIELGIADEYYIWVAPVILGQGRRLFDEPPALQLKLTKTKTFNTGVTLLCYQPGKAQKEKNNYSYATNSIE